MIDLLRQTGGVMAVLLLLAATLWWLDRKGLARFRGIRSSKTHRRMVLIERLPLTPNHSLHLVRIAGRVMLIAVAPSSCAVLETGPEAEVLARAAGMEAIT